ncbi:hypothetical protein ScPMuIL_003119 [Solemya velum]
MTHIMTVDFLLLHPTSGVLRPVVVRRGRMATVEVMWVVLIMSTAMISLEVECFQFSSEPGLVWLEYDGSTNRSGIRMFAGQPTTWETQNQKQQFISILVSGVQSLFKHVALHRRTGAEATIFVSDELKQQVNAVTFDEYGLEYIRQLFSAVSRHVNGIAVDWVSDVVFWTDSAYNTIYVGLMSLPATIQILIDTDLEQPYGIVAHSTLGFLFWTDTTRTCVERSTLGGRNRKVLYTKNIGKPTALTIDYDQNMLYWLDSYRGDIFRVTSMARVVGD